MSAPSFSQIKAQVAAIRQKVPQARVIGIRSPGRWTGEPLRQEGDQQYFIQQCDSPLAFRIALRQPTGDEATKVLITNLEETDLGDDVLLRLAKRRLFQIDPWQIVRSLFDAQAVDPRLVRHAWLAEALLEGVPTEGYPTARGGFLDAETVWPLLLRLRVGLPDESPDLTAILKWSLDAQAVAQFQRCSEEFRQGAGEWLSEKAGPVAGLVLKCIERLDRPDAVPIGLTAGVVYHPAAIGKLEKATGKLEERFLGGHSPETDQMRRWATAGTEVLRNLRSTAPKLWRQATQRADEILREVQADGMAYLSDISPLGFDQRLARMGSQLSDVVLHRSWDSLSQLSEARQALDGHDWSTEERRRLERVDMALRLLRWLATIDTKPPAGLKSFAQAANDYLRDGGYVDWARLTINGGDPVRPLSEAYAQIFNAVREIRQQQNREFARLLADWTHAGSSGGEILPVEDILEQIVAPLASEALVLVIVVDGMSVAVSRELLTDITRHEWFAISEPGRKFNRPGLATIPSVTEFSRNSLLRGRRVSGGSEEERIGFSEHPSLVARSRSGSPPILFHKALLQETDDSVLAAEVRKEIASTHRRIVGVVVNAVDDHLLKGEQLDTRWTRDAIKVLPALLHEARIARRLVVLVSDHGHVVDCQAEGRPLKTGEVGGERWRAAGRSDGGPADIAPDEYLVGGSRVLVSDQRLIAPWSEQVRYGIKKNGYHGGLTPQEMVIPIVVLSSTDELPKGWREQPIDIPAWWDESLDRPPSNETVLPPLQLIPIPTPSSGMLFSKDDDEDAAGRAVLAPEWVPSLLASEIYQGQKQLAGRGVPDDHVMAGLLVALDGRGGKMTSAGLARALQFPPMRLPGLLAKAERLLNVDGYDVLRRDDVSDTIEFNRELLLRQFDLVK
ncbi:MAG: BREX-2 system phosphatase PglZ [Pirellulales bacterium]